MAYNLRVQGVVKNGYASAVSCPKGFGVPLDLRNSEERLQALKEPLEGVAIMLLSCVVFLLWLGLLTIVVKALLG